jgi:phage tail sheath gpL-like
MTTPTFTEAVGGPVPGVETEIQLQDSGGLADPSKYRNVCFFGEKTTAGTGTAGTVYGPLDLAEIETLAGTDSPVHLMAAKFNAYRNSESGRPKASMYICCVAEEATGTAATQTLTFATNADGNGTWIFKVGGHQVRVNVRDGDDPTTQGDAFVAAYNALPAESRSALAPVNAVGVVTLTAKVKGEDLNTVGLSTLQDPGVTTTATWGGTSMSGGLGVQTGNLTTALAALAGEDGFANLVVSWRDDATLEELVDHVNTKANAQNMISSYMIWANDDTVANLVTDAAGLDSNDSQRVMTNGLEGTESWNGEVAATAAATLASEPHLARSLDGLRASNLDAPSQADKFTQSDLRTLLEGGVTPWYVHKSETEVGLCRAIMNRSEFGVVDFAHMRVADFIRDSINLNIRNNLTRASIVQDGLPVPNVEFVTTPDGVAALIRSVLKDAEKGGYITNVDALFEKFISELDITNGELRQAFPQQMVTQLHNIMTRIDVLV